MALSIVPFSFFSRELFSFRKRILASYCFYVLTFSEKGSSLSFRSSRAPFILARTSSSCSYCSNLDYSYPTGGGAANIGDNVSDNVSGIISSNLIEAIPSGKITSIVPKELLGPAEHSSEPSSEASRGIPKGYQDSRVLLVGDGDLSFAASLSTLGVCKRLADSAYVYNLSFEIKVCHITV